MGCDIHHYIEIRKDKWEVYEWEYLCRACGKNGQPEKYSDGTYVIDYEKMWNHPLEIGRNYSLFGILANVRNGYGFAGISTGTGFSPISMPSGLPKDVSLEVKRESDNWGVDGHSHSYLTLQDLIDYDWNQITIRSGVVNSKEYKDFLKNGRPNSWSGWVSGGKTKYITNKEMEDKIKLGKSLNDLYTEIEWKESYKSCCLKFYEKTIPALKKLGEPDNVRLVFWFDN